MKFETFKKKINELDLSDTIESDYFDIILKTFAEISIPGINQLNIGDVVVFKNFDECIYEIVKFDACIDDGPDIKLKVQLQEPGVNAPFYVDVNEIVKYEFYDFENKIIKLHDVLYSIFDETEYCVVDAIDLESSRLYDKDGHSIDFNITVHEKPKFGADGIAVLKNQICYVEFNKFPVVVRHIENNKVYIDIHDDGALIEIDVSNIYHYDPNDSFDKIFDDLCRSHNNCLDYFEVSYGLTKQHWMYKEYDDESVFADVKRRLVGQLLKEGIRWEDYIGVIDVEN